MNTERSPVIRVERGCSAGPEIGCCCTGHCHELIDVVPAADYWRAIGERDEARRMLKLAHLVDTPKLTGSS